LTLKSGTNTTRRRKIAGARIGGDRVGDAMASRMISWPR